MSAYSSMIVNGWTIYTHPLFDEQYQMLKQKVVQDKQKDPVGYVKKNNTGTLPPIAARTAPEPFGSTSDTAVPSGTCKI